MVRKAGTEMTVMKEEVVIFQDPWKQGGMAQHCRLGLVRKQREPGENMDKSPSCCYHGKKGTRQDKKV